MIFLIQFVTCGSGDSCECLHPPEVWAQEKGKSSTDLNGESGHRPVLGMWDSIDRQ